MELVKKTTLITCIVGGLLVLASYVPIGVLHSRSEFDFWLGLPSNTRQWLYALMFLAAAGFCMVIYDYLNRDLPIDGLFARLDGYAFPIIIGIILLFSFLWSVFVILLSQQSNSTNLTSVESTLASKGIGIATSVSLIIVAVATILLIAGQSERSDSTPQALLGAVLLGVVTVLVDGVAWDSKLLYKLFN